MGELRPTAGRHGMRERYARAEGYQVKLRAYTVRTDLYCKRQSLLPGTEMQSSFPRFAFTLLLDALAVAGTDPPAAQATMALLRTVGQSN